jgi:hypothetical protein
MHPDRQGSGRRNGEHPREYRDSIGGQAGIAARETAQVGQDAGINGNARRHVLCSAVPALSCIDTVRDTATRTTKVHTVNCV